MPMQPSTTTKKLKRKARPKAKQLQGLEVVDAARVQASTGITDERRADLGQVMTPMAVASFMAGMFSNSDEHPHLLDAGAGVGSLTAAWVAHTCEQRPKPKSIRVTLFELEPEFVVPLRSTIERCKAMCRAANISFAADLHTEDFVEFSVRRLTGDLLVETEPLPTFTSTILNPPYRKVNTASRTRRLLDSVDAGTTNLYTAFLTLAARMLRPDGQMVAITPRSFCNGPYFKPFRTEFLRTMSLQRVHIFSSRSTAFADDGVLQENIICHATKSAAKSMKVQISSSAQPTEADCTSRKVPLREVVRPDDPHSFIWITSERTAQAEVEKMRSLTGSLKSVGLTVSTGRVVDFRAKQHLLKEPLGASAPLIYPGHFLDGFVRWPRADYRKPNAIARSPETAGLLIPSAVYTVAKRFSSKEERRRIVAAVYDPTRFDTDVVGFENHLNYFHAAGQGLPMNLAKGLAVFLNSSIVDSYFRQFNGHTQVNATDLRSLPYPSRETLIALGRSIENTMPPQAAIDALVERLVFHDRVGDAVA